MRECDLDFFVRVGSGEALLDDWDGVFAASEVTPEVEDVDE